MAGCNVLCDECIWNKGGARHTAEKVSRSEDEVGSDRTYLSLSMFARLGWKSASRLSYFASERSHTVHAVETFLLLGLATGSIGTAKVGIVGEGWFGSRGALRSDTEELTGEDIAPGIVAAAIAYIVP